jgi:hypothetical protein
MTDVQTFDIYKIVLDKGLLALVIVLASYLATRAVERFKTGNAWILELARQRRERGQLIVEALTRLGRAHSALDAVLRVDQSLSSAGVMTAVEEYEQAIQALEQRAEAAVMWFGSRNFEDIETTIPAQARMKLQNVRRFLAAGSGSPERKLVRDIAELDLALASQIGLARDRLVFEVKKHVSL